MKKQMKKKKRKRKERMKCVKKDGEKKERK